MANQVAKGIVIGGLILALILGIFIYVVPQILSTYFPQAPVTTPAKYSTGLIAYFQIYDKTGASFITSDASPEFYSTGEEPFAYTFTGSPLTVGAYDSVKGAWKTVLDSGSYLLLVKDTASTKTKYPELVTVTVPATDNEDREVSIDPYMVTLVQRASVSISTTIKAYNSTSGAYDISVSNINITAYDKWLTTYEFTIAGTDKVIKAGRLYITKISGLIPKKAYLDGQEVSIVEDADASDDGMSGYYIAFVNDWKGGEIHRLDIYWEDVGASTGTLKLTLFDYYACLNTDLRWWTEETASITVTS